MKESSHTSIMNKKNDGRFIPEVDLLYTDYGVSSEKIVIKSSRHDFWQMEFVLEGTMLVCFDKAQIALSEKQILIIPPGIKHNFVYNKPRKTWNLKFIQSSDFIDKLEIVM